MGWGEHQIGRDLGSEQTAPDEFGESAERAKVQPELAMIRYKCAIATCARWEADNIVEWVLYHRSIGFDHFYIYCNDDDPVELFDRLLPFTMPSTPLVTFRHFSIQGQQSQMLQHFLRHYVHECDWIMFLDVDEFLNLPRHTSIGAFLLDMPAESQLIYFNWIFFGNSGFSRNAPGSTLLNYTRRSTAPHVLTKTLTRTRNIDDHVLRWARSCHFWHNWGEDIARSWRAVNVLGEPIEHYFRDFPDGASRFINSGDRGRRLIETGIINHYAFRSEDEFLRRFRRGLGGEFAGQHIWKDLYESGKSAQFLAALNEVEDLRLHAYWSRYIGRAWKYSIIPRPIGDNIAAAGQAIQSSISEWSRRQSVTEDASGAISGHIANAYQCHTALEHDPWWQLDLGRSRRIVQLRIYNRCEFPELAARANNLKIEVAPDGETLTEIYRRVSETPFGGADGNPLIVSFDTPIVCAVIRITLLGHTFLHFDQVEVYADEGA